jgi:hypothetical protein
MNFSSFGLLEFQLMIWYIEWALFVWFWTERDTRKLESSREAGPTLVALIAIWEGEDLTGQ